MQVSLEGDDEVNRNIRSGRDIEASAVRTRLEATGEILLAADRARCEDIDAKYSSTTFTYRRLKEIGGIRLVLIHPASNISACLECSIEHTTLSQCDEDLISHFTALSYVWGDATDTRQITVEGCPFQVTATLDLALRRLRDSKRVNRVWADAMCINQADTDERNHEVRQMGTVYSIARHTVIELGEGSNKTDSLFDQLLAFGMIGNVSMHEKLDGSALEALAKAWKSKFLDGHGSLGFGCSKSSSYLAILGYNAAAND